ncbi:protein-tyrosine phosphatase-like protein [Zopfochytrium polystomum]|nr:protein-tyrosine phosphatase-like protein [Zopfochytrium polystomum]
MPRQAGASSSVQRSSGLGQAAAELGQPGIAGPAMSARTVGGDPGRRGGGAAAGAGVGTGTGAGAVGGGGSGVAGPRGIDAAIAALRSSLTSSSTIFKLCPSWLRTIASLQPVAAKDHFALLFAEIEKAEASRWEIAAADHDALRAGRVDPDAAVAETSPQPSSASSRRTPTATVPPFTMRAALARVNSQRNRYSDILPFDHSRVRLTHPSLPRLKSGAPDPSSSKPSDYINASFLTTLSRRSLQPDAPPVDPMAISPTLTAPPLFRRNAPHTFISTQGPLPSTTPDFWSLVWDQGVSVVVMLTSLEEHGRTKCHRYWPEPTSGGPDSFLFPHGPAHVLRVAATSPSRHSPAAPAPVPPAVSVREFTLTRSTALTPHGASAEDQHLVAGETRTVRQLHYTAWADHKGADAKIVLAVVALAGSLQEAAISATARGDYSRLSYGASPSIPPMVVHCSAGCGRTGTFCVIDAVITKLVSRWEALFAADSATLSIPVASDDDNTDWIFALVKLFREQRVSMVQTLEQFMFCYEATILWLLDAAEGAEGVATFDGWRDSGIAPIGCLGLNV